LGGSDNTYFSTTAAHDKESSEPVARVSFNVSVESKPRRHHGHQHDFPIHAWSYSF